MYDNNIFGNGGPNNANGNPGAAGAGAPNNNGYAPTGDPNMNVGGYGQPQPDFSQNRSMYFLASLFLPATMNSM